MNKTPLQLHDLFCFHSRQKLNFNHFRFRWETWACLEGHNAESLVLVLEYLNHRRATASEAKYQPSLSLNRLLDDAGWFACQVEAAESWQREQKAKKRQPTDVNRQETLQATGRPTAPPDKVTTPEQVLRTVAERAELVAAMRRATL